MCPLVQLGLDCLKIEVEVNNRHTVVANYLEVGTTSQQFTLKQLFPINKITTYLPGQKEQLKLQFYVEENWDKEPLFKKEGRPNFEKDYKITQNG